MVTTSPASAALTAGAVAPAKRVVLQGPEGRYLPLRVKYTSMIRNVKPGDSVEATFIEALVVEVVGPKQ